MQISFWWSAVRFAVRQQNKACLSSHLVAPSVSREWSQLSRSYLVSEDGAVARESFFPAAYIFFRIHLIPNNMLVFALRQELVSLGRRVIHAYTLWSAEQSLLTKNKKTVDSVVAASQKGEREMLAKALSETQKHISVRIKRQIHGRTQRVEGFPDVTTYRSRAIFPLYRPKKACAEILRPASGWASACVARVRHWARWILLSDGGYNTDNEETKMQMSSKSLKACTPVNSNPYLNHVFFFKENMVLI